MNTKTNERLVQPDTRSQAQKDFDESVAVAAESGNWEGFETTELLTEDGARQIIEFCETLEPNAVLAQITKQPFRWKQFVFRVVRCEYSDGEAHVEVKPHDAEFAAELKRRIETNRFHYLPYYQGFGFIAFPEDYLRYKD